MSKKIPPPPFFTGPEWQGFNRWLLEVTSVLSNQGGINPDEVDGLPALFDQVATNTDDITALNNTVDNQNGQIGAVQADVTGLQNSVATINGQITTLSARAQVLNGITAPGTGLGNVSDWYADTVAKHVYVKTAVGTWTLIV